MQMVQNMGSLLQSYSLKRLLEEMGNEVTFLPIEPRKDDDSLMGGNRNSLSCEVQSNKFSERLKRVDIYLINRLKMKVKLRTQSAIYDNFRSGKLGIDIDCKNDTTFDWCVIGSDEVFNCCDSSPWGFTTQLFGDVSEANRVITYAASCGATVAEQIPEAARERIKEALKSVEAISVRDDNTKCFVEDISGRSAEINFDPVLVGDFEKEIESCDEIRGLSKKYCVVYAYYNRIYRKNEIKAIKEFCDSHNLSPVAIGMPQFWIKDYITADPFQCLKIFRCADFVITDTFHGTIFSAKYCPRFATVVRNSNRNKLQDLINRIGASEHSISAITVEELEKAYKKTHDKESFNRLIEAEREHTLLYLKNILKENTEWKDNKQHGKYRPS